jgi:hypothetical protein
VKRFLWLLGLMCMLTPPAAWGQASSLGREPAIKYNAQTRTWYNATRRAAVKTTPTRITTPRAATTEFVEYVLTPTAPASVTAPAYAPTQSAAPPTVIQAPYYGYTSGYGGYASYGYNAYSNYGYNAYGYGVPCQSYISGHTPYVNINGSLVPYERLYGGSGITVIVGGRPGWRPFEPCGGIQVRGRLHIR